MSGYSYKYIPGTQGPCRIDGFTDNQAVQCDFQI